LRAAGITDMTSTKIRHHLSTLRAEEDNKDADLFYDHMGHSREINKLVYQAPRAKNTLASVGKFLDKAYTREDQTENIQETVI